MSALALGSLAFIAGAIGSWIAIAGLFLIAFSGTPDRDGGRSMAIVFGIGPFAAVVGGVVAAWLTTRRKAATSQDGSAGLTSIKWICGVLATLSLGVAATQAMAAGRLSDVAVTFAIAAAFGVAAWVLPSRR